MTDASKDGAEAKPAGNYTEVINGEEVTTVVSKTAAPVETTNKRKEAQVKITVAQESTEAPAPTTAPKEVPRSFDEESYNRYLLDASGPRKVIDYSKPEGYEDA